MTTISETYNIDCLEYMRVIQDKWFDLAIVDPPYGISAPLMPNGAGSKDHPKGSSASKCRFSGAGKLKDRAIQTLNTEWDKYPPTQEYFTELFRVSKNQVIFGSNYFPLPPTRCIGVWDKVQPWPNFSAFELIWTSFDYPSFIIRIRNARGACGSNKIHPCQKPIELYANIIAKFAKDGDKIFDSHMGSQSSRIAAYKMGFDYWGCEIDGEYFKTGEVRFQRECMGTVTLGNGMKVIQNQLFEV